MKLQNQDIQERHQKEGQVLWITGLSASGKTTLAKALYPYFSNAILLDGDTLREMLGSIATSDESYTIEKRKELAFLYARLCKMLAIQGFTVIIGTISLFHDVHAWNRENLSNYCEIFLDIPEEIRRSRDQKGLYEQQENGKTSMAGIETQIEYPLNPHLIVNELDTIDIVIKKIFNLLLGS